MCIFGKCTCNFPFHSQLIYTTNAKQRRRWWDVLDTPIRIVSAFIAGFSYFSCKGVIPKCPLRPGAHQSSKAAFGKSAFAKTCFLLLKIRHGAHQSSKKQKCFLSTFWQVLTRFSRKHFARCTWPDHCFPWSKDAPSKSKSASRKSAFTKS